MWGGTALPADGCLCLGLPGELLLCCPIAAGCPPAARCPLFRAQPSAWGGPSVAGAPTYIGGGGAPRPVEMLPSSRCHKTSESRKQLRLLDVNEVCGVLV